MDNVLETAMSNAKRRPSRSDFDDFARRWLFSGPRKEELANYMADFILQGPLQRVPAKLRKVAVALRTLRAGAQVARMPGRVRTRQAAKQRK